MITINLVWNRSTGKAFTNKKPILPRISAQKHITKLFYIIISTNLSIPYLISPGHLLAEDLSLNILILWICIWNSEFLCVLKLLWRYMLQAKSSWLLLKHLCHYWSPHWEMSDKHLRNPMVHRIQFVSSKIWVVVEVVVIDQ